MKASTGGYHKLKDGHKSTKHEKGARKGFTWKCDLQTDIDVGGFRFCGVERISKREIRITAADVIS